MKKEEERRREKGTEGLMEAQRGGRGKGVRLERVKREGVRQEKGIREEEGERSDDGEERRNTRN